MNKDDEHNRNIQNSWNNDGQGIPKNVQAGKNANVQKTSEYATDECVTSSTEQTNNSKAELVTLALQSWSGILPPPEYFNAYDEKAKEYIYKWVDALIIDESKREEKIVKTRAISDLLSALFNLAIVIIIGVSFTITRDPAIFGLLSLPLFTACINIVFVHKDKDNEKDK